MRSVRPKFITDKQNAPELFAVVVLGVVPGVVRGVVRGVGLFLSARASFSATNLAIF